MIFFYKNYTFHTSINAYNNHWNITGMSIAISWSNRYSIKLQTYPQAHRKMDEYSLHVFKFLLKVHFLHFCPDSLPPPNLSAET